MFCIQMYFSNFPQLCSHVMHTLIILVCIYGLFSFVFFKSCCVIPSSVGFLRSQPVFISDFERLAKKLHFGSNSARGATEIIANAKNNQIKANGNVQMHR